jgi:hypothetical protein
MTDAAHHVNVTAALEEETADGRGCSVLRFY